MGPSELEPLVGTQLELRPSTYKGGQAPSGLSAFILSTSHNCRSAGPCFEDEAFRRSRLERHVDPLGKAGAALAAATDARRFAGHTSLTLNHHPERVRVWRRRLKCLRGGDFPKSSNTSFPYIPKQAGWWIQS
jgi:hypothetical protein